MKKDLNDPMLNYFELHYQRYDAWYEKYTVEYDDESEFIDAFIPEGNGLEIGVSTGRFASRLGIEYGIEISKAMIKKAKDRGIRCVEGDAHELPFKDHSFEYAIYIFTLCFLEHPERSLKEAKRVAKNVISVIIDKESAYAVKLARERNGFYRYAKFYSSSDLLRLYYSSEFSDIETKEKELVASEGLKYKLIVISGS